MLTAEMAKTKVEFKFLEEFNQLAEKYERKWTALDGKQLQIVLEKLDIKRVMEAVADVDVEGVSELWSVRSPQFALFTPSLCIKPFRAIKCHKKKYKIQFQGLNLNGQFQKIHAPSMEGFLEF